MSRKRNTRRSTSVASETLETKVLLSAVSLSPHELVSAGTGQNGRTVVSNDAEPATNSPVGEQDPVVSAGLFGFGGFNPTLYWHEGGPSSAYGDFDNDGYLDHVTGNPYKDLSFAANGGQVEIQYGGPGKGMRTLNQNQFGMESGAEEGDWFGAALAVGDFNGDGYDDLAVGVPNQNVDGESSAGAVHVVYGSQNGITARGNHLIHQTRSVPDSRSEWGDHFGEVLTVGDFNGDGADDLAVGVPSEGIHWTESNAGAVSVFHGSYIGLQQFGTNFYQDREFVRGASEKGDRFGTALVSADFNGDGFDDLAVGVPGEDIEQGFWESLGTVGDSEPSHSGVVHVFYGTSDGLGSAGDRILRQGKDGVLDHSNTGDWFGSELTTGDFNGDGVADLAVGVPSEDLHASGANAGMVNILYGSTQFGLSGLNNQIFTQDAVGIFGASKENGHFGFRVMGGDFNGDGFDDLVVASTLAEGELVVLYGTSSGLQDLTANGAPLGVQDILVDVADKDIRDFHVTTADFNNDGYADMKMSSRRKSNEEYIDSHILYGSRRGLSTTPPSDGNPLAGRDEIVRPDNDTLARPDDKPEPSWNAVDSVGTETLPWPDLLEGLRRMRPRDRQTMTMMAQSRHSSIWTATGERCHSLKACFSCDIWPASQAMRS